MLQPLKIYIHHGKVLRSRLSIHRMKCFHNLCMILINFILHKLKQKSKTFSISVHHFNLNIFIWSIHLHSNAPLDHVCISIVIHYIVACMVHGWINRVALLRQLGGALAVPHDCYNYITHFFLGHPRADVTTVPLKLLEARF